MLSVVAATLEQEQGSQSLGIGELATLNHAINIGPAQVQDISNYETRLRKFIGMQMHSITLNG